MSLRVPPAVAAQMHMHLRGCYPEEGCGVLLGLEAGGSREVARVVSIDNQREDSRGNRYLIAPEQLLHAERAGREQGLDVLGFYHSHPDHPALPSAFDVEHAWPYYSYVIVSVRGGRVADTRAWRLAEDRSHFDPEPMELPEAVTSQDAAAPAEPEQST